MRNLALAVAVSLSGCAVTLDVPRGGCLNWRGYAYTIPNPYRGGSLGQRSGSTPYVGDKESTEHEQSSLLLADPATRADETLAQRERTASKIVEIPSLGLLTVALGALPIGPRYGWSESFDIAIGTSAAVGALTWGISAALIHASKKHAERARRVFNQEAVATGSCPPTR